MSTERICRYLALVLAAAAVWVRLPSDPPALLWLDETWRAAGALGSSHNMLLLPSEWFFANVGVAMLGRTEWAVRIWPLLASVVSMGAAWSLLRRTASAPAALLGVFLLGFGGEFVLHAREFKPYALDLALALSTLLAAVRYGEAADAAARRSASAVLALVLSVSALSSLTFVFVYPAVALYVVVVDRPRSVRDALPLAVPGALFLFVYWVALRPQVGAGSLPAYWQDFFPTSAKGLQTLAASAREAVGSHLLTGWPLSWVAYLIALPVLSLRRGDRLWLLLLTPLAVQTALAALHVYPLFDRPSHYLYGLMAVATCYALDGVVRAFAPRSASRAALVAVFAIIGVVTATGRLRAQLEPAMAWPPDRGREVLRELGENFRPGDSVLSGYGAVFLLDYYRPRLHADNQALLEQPLAWKFALGDSDPGLLCATLSLHAPRFRAGRRIWLISSHTANAYVLYQDLLRRVGTVKVHVREPWESLVSVDLKKPLTALPCLKR